MCHTGYCSNEGVNGECTVEGWTKEDCDAGGGNDHPEIYEYPDSFDPRDVKTIKRYAGLGVS